MDAPFDTVKIINAQTICADLHFLSALQKPSHVLDTELEICGFRKYQNIPVEEIECFVYTPLSFPQNAREAEEFGFSKYKKDGLTIGICFGGLINKCHSDEKLKERLQTFLEHKKGEKTANEAAYTIQKKLQEFLNEYPKISNEGITLKIRISGYCLGGMFATATTILLEEWRRQTNSEIVCRTYDSCGLPEVYSKEVRKYTVEEPDYWNQRITNFKSFPNPFNSACKDLGHIYLLSDIAAITTGENWARTCLSESARRVLLYQGICDAILGNAVDLVTEVFDAFQEATNATKQLANDLGVEPARILETHDTDVMLGCFSQEGQIQQQDFLREMKSWPTWDLMKSSVPQKVCQITKRMIPFDPRNPGLHTFLLHRGQRKPFIEKQLLRLPGFEFKSVHQPRCIFQNLMRRCRSF